MGLSVIKKKLLKELWNKSSYYYKEGRRSTLDRFGKSPATLKIMNYCANARKVLDCGCGDGTMMELIAHQNMQIIGIDISQIALKIGKNRVKRNNIHFVCGDIERLPFKNNVFDCVYSAWVLEHLVAPERIVDEMVRVTNIGGYIIFVSPNYGSPLYMPPEQPYTIKSILVGFFKTHLYSHRRKSVKNLDWEVCYPIILNSENPAQDWSPDMDVTVRPYLYTLIKYLQNKGIKILEWDCGFEWKNLSNPQSELSRERFGLKLIQKSVWRVIKKLCELAGRLKIPPYKYYGPILFVVGKKIAYKILQKDEA